MKNKKTKNAAGAQKSRIKILQAQRQVLALTQAGQVPRAIEFLRGACEGANPNPVLLSTLGLLECRAGMLQIGLIRTKEAMEKSRRNPEILINYGEVLGAQGFIKEAIHSFRTALGYAPQSQKAHYKLAEALIKGERFDNAVLILRDYINKYKDDLDGSILLAQALYKSKKFEDAERIFSQTIENNPEIISIYEKYFTMLFAEGKLSLLESRLTSLIDSQSGIANDQISLIHADLISITRTPDAALDVLSKIHKARPGSAQISRHRRTTLLGAGKLRDGWQALYEEPGRLTRIAKLPHRVWLGEDSPEKTLLIRGAEGIGEQLMYSQLFDYARKKTRRLVVECDFRLLEIFRRSFSDIEFVSWLSPPAGRLMQNDIDLQTSPRDIAKFCLDTVDDIPGITRSLTPHDNGRSLADRLRDLFPNKLLVGISWRSSSGIGFVEKTIPLSYWTDILKQTDVQFIDLQYGSAESETELVKEKLGVDIVRPPHIDLTNDIDECMGLISGLDLVITVSNVTAHYAGSVGTPVWVLLSKSPVWHWFRERGDSPWYPSAKLYRQKPDENWEPVLASVAGDLSALRRETS